MEEVVERQITELLPKSHRAVLQRLVVGKAGRPVEDDLSDEIAPKAIDTEKILLRDISANEEVVAETNEGFTQPFDIVNTAFYRERIEGWRRNSLGEDLVVTNDLDDVRSEVDVGRALSVGHQVYSTESGHVRLDRPEKK